MHTTVQLLLLYIPSYYCTSQYKTKYTSYGCTNFVTKLVLGFIVMIERRLVRLMSDDDDDDVAVNPHSSL